MYKESFQAIASAPPITSIEDNWEFVKRLEVLVRNHANDVPVLSRG